MTTGPDPNSLFEGLDGRAVEEREELISWLLDQGFELGQIAGAVSPMFLPANRVLGHDGTLVSADDVAQASGVPVELIQRLHRAVGLAYTDDPSEELFARADAEAVLPAAALVDLGIDIDLVVLALRLLVEGLTDAAVAMRHGSLKTILSPGAREVDLARAFEHLALQVRPSIEAMITEIALLTLRHSFETEAITFSERSAGALPGAREITVAFADLVGFTQLGEELTPEELGELVDTFVGIARDVIVEPVRLVKTIGDAVMLVSSEPAKLVTTVLQLMEAAVSRSLQLRAGVATGLAVSRAGDWYGSPVNVASRITDAAHPGTVWVAEPTRRAITSDSEFNFTSLGERTFKGVRNATGLYEVRRS